jgi:hypothetical protein
MRLENKDLSRVGISKVIYLVDPAHPKNGGKARLLNALGYREDNWHQLDTDLREQHLVLDAEEVERNIHGRKYEIVGPLRGPAGTANILSIWIIRWGEDFSRFVTAYKAD